MEIDEAANIASLSWLPNKSRKKYEFTKWCAKKNVMVPVPEKVMVFTFERS